MSLGHVIHSTVEEPWGCRGETVSSSGTLSAVPDYDYEWNFRFSDDMMINLLQLCYKTIKIIILGYAHFFGNERYKHMLMI